MSELRREIAICDCPAKIPSPEAAAAEGIAAVEKVLRAYVREAVEQLASGGTIRELQRSRR